MDIGLGSIVLAKAGRDKGDFFVVVASEGEFAYICDGKTRKYDKPKKKKLKHLAVTHTVSALICEKLGAGDKVTNNEIRRAIGEFRENHEQ